MERISKARWLIVFVFVGALAADPLHDTRWAEWRPLVGSWVAVNADGVPGKPSDGNCSFSFNLQGAIIVRKNHAAYPAIGGRPAMVHDDLMMIFHRGEAVQALYCDSEGHVIDYVISYSASDKRWTCLSEPAAHGPRYRLTYLLASPQELKLKFELAPPDHPDAFKTYINAILRRDDASTTAMQPTP